MESNVKLTEERIFHLAVDDSRYIRSRGVWYISDEEKFIPAGSIMSDLLNSILNEQREGQTYRNRI